MVAAIQLEYDEMLDLTDAGSAVSAPAAGSVARYDADLKRCVAEAVLRYRRLALWRVRLRPITATLAVPAYDDEPDDPSYAALSAQVAVRPKYASIPGTHGLFMPDTPREQRLVLTAARISPAFTPGTTVVSAATLDVGERTWDLEVNIETVLNDGERIILAVTGAVPREVPTPFAGAALHIDAAVEFRRWM